MFERLEVERREGGEGVEARARPNALGGVNKLGALVRHRRHEQQLTDKPGEAAFLEPREHVT